MRLNFFCIVLCPLYKGRGGAGRPVKVMMVCIKVATVPVEEIR